MSEALQRERQSPGRAWRFLDGLRLALAFLTILPVGPPGAAPPEAQSESFAYFPVAGFLIGVLLAAEDWLLAFAFDRAIRSALIIFSLAVLAGAVHLDGVADTADALGAGRDRERALAILRDSAIGSFGAIAVFFVLALKIVALAAIPEPRRFAALFVAPGLARWAMVAVSYEMNYLRSQGAGSAILASRGAGNLAFATVVTIAFTALAASRRMLLAFVATLITALLLRWFYRRWLGGVTGDLVGAAGEVAEVIVLLVLSAACPSQAALI